VNTIRNAAPWAAWARSSAAPAALLAAVLVLSSASDAPAQGQQSNDNGPSRGVAALGRLEPAGGIVRVGVPSTPDAVSGAILGTLHVERGQDVSTGQVIAEMDTAPVVRARIAESRAGLETARLAAQAADSLATEACVLADVAARQARRKTELLGRGLASDEETELAKGDAEASAASCAARRAEARVAQSRIASAEAVLARHEAELGRSMVRAPFGGRVLDVLTKPGELVGVEGVIELGRVSEMHAIAEVYETDIRFVRVGQAARVSSEALPSPLAGKVMRIRPKVHKQDEIGTDPAARKDARIIEVEILLEDPAAAANLTNLQVEVEIGR
jgi:HlyD family secretion protein